MSVIQSLCWDRSSAVAFSRLFSLFPGPPLAPPFSLSSCRFGNLGSPTPEAFRGGGAVLSLEAMEPGCDLEVDVNGEEVFLVDKVSHHSTFSPPLVRSRS